jgi:hypothetical protein
LPGTHVAGLAEPIPARLAALASALVGAHVPISASAMMMPTVMKLSLFRILPFDW